MATQSSTSLSPAGERRALAWLVSPTAPEAFLGEYLERQPLVVSREDPGYFDGLLCVRDLDERLSVTGLTTDQVRVVHGGRSLDSAEFAYESGLVDVVRLSARHRDGGTIIFENLDGIHPPLARLCRALESEMSTRFQANGYLTPAAAKGFRSHYDNHDVIVLQLEGTKSWRLFDTPVELPHRGQHFSPDEVAPAPCTREFVLKPGDSCYIPRGVMHEAVTTDVRSLHVTIGILHTTWAEMIIEAVARASLNLPSLRRGLPTGFAQPGFDRADARAYFGELMARVSATVDFDAAMDHFADDLISTRHPVLSGQLTAAQEAEGITGSTLVGAIPHVLYQLERNEQSVVVHCYGHDVEFPEHTDAALSFALVNPTYRPSDLPGDLDDAGKLVLIQRLVLEGLVRRIEDADLASG